MTLRKIDYENGTREEIFSTHTELFWDPATNDGMIRFRTMKFTYLGDTVIAREPHGYHEYPLSQVLDRSYTVRTPVGPMDVSGLLVMGAMKEAFDVLFNETNAPPVIDPETQPEPVVVEESSVTPAPADEPAIE